MVEHLLHLASPHEFVNLLNDVVGVAPHLVVLMLIPRQSIVETHLGILLRSTRSGCLLGAAHLLGVELIQDFVEDLMPADQMPEGQSGFLWALNDLSDCFVQAEALAEGHEYNDLLSLVSHSLVIVTQLVEECRVD